MFNRFFNYLADFLKPKHKPASNHATSQALAASSSAADLARSMSSMSNNSSSTNFMANLQKAVGMSQSSVSPKAHQKISISNHQAFSSNSTESVASGTSSSRSSISSSTARSEKSSATSSSSINKKSYKSSSAIHVNMGRISPKSVDSANKRAANIESSNAQSSKSSQSINKSSATSVPFVPINRKSSKHEAHQHKHCYMAIFDDKIQFNSAMCEFLRHRRYLKVGINPETQQLAFIIGNNKEYDLHLGIRKHKRNGHFHYSYKPYTNRTVIDALVANIKQGHKGMDLNNYGYHLYATDFRTDRPKMVIFSYDSSDQNIKKIANDTKKSSKENDSNGKASKLIQERIDQGTER